MIHRFSPSTHESGIGRKWGTSLTSSSHHLPPRVLSLTAGEEQENDQWIWRPISPPPTKRDSLSESEIGFCSLSCHPSLAHRERTGGSCGQMKVDFSPPPAQGPQSLRLLTLLLFQSREKTRGGFSQFSPTTTPTLLSRETRGRESVACVTASGAGCVTPDTRSDKSSGPAAAGAAFERRGKRKAEKRGTLYRTRVFAGSSEQETHRHTEGAGSSIRLSFGFTVKCISPSLRHPADPSTRRQQPHQHPLLSFWQEKKNMSGKILRISHVNDLIPGCDYGGSDWRKRRERNPSDRKCAQQQKCMPPFRSLVSHDSHTLMHRDLREKRQESNFLPHLLPYARLFVGATCYPHADSE